MKLTFEEMMVEADQMVRDDRLDAEDRATIMGFYNGGTEGCGNDRTVNHLIGFDNIGLAKTQIESIGTKGEAMFNFDLSNLPQDRAHFREKWKLAIRTNFARMMKNSRRFKPEWKSVAGEIALFGNGSLVFRDPYDWCPVMARPYVPRGSGQLPEGLSYVMLCDTLTHRDLKDALHSAEKRKEMGLDSPWRESELRTCIASLEGSLKRKPVTSLLSTLGEQPDVDEEDRQSGASSTQSKMTIPVYYFFIHNDDRTVSMTILPRLTVNQTTDIVQNNLQTPKVLFHQEEYFDSMRSLMMPFFVDCKIGGKASWHRVLGLGRLNYDSDVEAEEFFNDAMQGGRENLRRLYQVESTADWDQLKMWGDGNGPSNALPPGVKLADVSRQPNMQYAMQPLQMLMQLTRRNASQMSTETGRRAGELEVQAIERQSRNAEALASRMNDLYECLDALGAEMFSRAISNNCIEGDPGYHEIKEFQDSLRRAGVPVEFLRRRDKSGKLLNVGVRCSRAAGDGNSVKRSMANRALMERLPLFSGEAQQIILRRITAEELDDQDFAERIVPFEPKRDTNQVTVAATENEMCFNMGITGRIPNINPDDIDQTHLEIHLASMEGDLARGKIRQWDQIDLAAFQAKGSHAMAHINRMSASKVNRQAAQAAKVRLQGLAKQGQEFANNLQKKQEADELSQKDKMELELKGKKQALAERQQNALEQHRAAALSLSAAKNNVTMQSMAAQTEVAIDKHLHDKMVDGAQLALDRQQMINDQQQQEPTSPDVSAV